MTNQGASRRQGGKGLAAALLALCGLLAASAGEAATAEPRPGDPRPMRQRLGDIIDPVKIENAPAKQAFAWWSATTDIPLLINWNQFQMVGIDPDTPINLDLRNVPAGRVLAMLMQQTQLDQELVYEIAPWAVQVMTKAEANRRPVVRVYQVTDLLHMVPLVAERREVGAAGAQAIGGGRLGGEGGTGATAGTGDRFSSTARRGTAVGGSGRSVGAAEATRLGGGRTTSRGGAAATSGAGGSLFTTTTSTGVSLGATGTTGVALDEEAAQRLVEVIRGTIEPDLWQENGGDVASIRFFNGSLIVKAPMYVHGQISSHPVSGRVLRPVR